MPAASLDAYFADLVQLGIGPISEGLYGYLSKVDVTRLNALITQLDTLKANKPRGRNQGNWRHQVGKLYEEIIQTLFKDSEVFEAQTNVRTTTGEVDVALRCKAMAVYVPFLTGKAHLLAEAKCHDKSPKSDWITEMVGNFQMHNTDLGILFIYSKPTTLKREFRQAIAVGVGGQKVVIPFGKKQLSDICSGSSLLDVLSKQHHCCTLHSKIEI